MLKRQGSGLSVTGGNGGRNVARRRFSGFSDAESGPRAAIQNALSPVHEDEELSETGIPRTIGGKGEVTDDISVLSTTAQLLSTYIPEAQTKDVPKGFVSEEEKLLGIQDVANLPEVDALIETLLENPRKSILFQMGEERLKTCLQTLGTQVAKWELDRLSYDKKETEKITEKEAISQIRANAAEDLRIAAENYHALDFEYNTTVNTCHEYKAQKQKYERRLAIGRLLVAAINRLVQEDHLPWSGTKPGLIEGTDDLIGHVKKVLKIGSYKDCKGLSRAECLGIYHILDLCGFDCTDFFKGLFKFPPDGLSRVDFFDAYGPHPHIKTSKDMNLVVALQKRVAHYLGMSTDDDSSTDIDVESLTAEELQRELDEMAASEAALKAREAALKELLRKKNGAQG